MSHTDNAVQAVRKRALKIIQAAIRKGESNETIGARYGITAQGVANWRDNGGTPRRSIAEKIVRMENES